MILLTTLSDLAYLPVSGLHCQRQRQTCHGQVAVHSTLGLTTKRVVSRVGRRLNANSELLQPTRNFVCSFGLCKLRGLNHLNWSCGLICRLSVPGSCMGYLAGYCLLLNSHCLFLRGLWVYADKLDSQGLQETQVETQNNRQSIPKARQCCCSASQLRKGWRCGIPCRAS